MAYGGLLPKQFAFFSFVCFGIVDGGSSKRRKYISFSQIENRKGFYMDQMVRGPLVLEERWVLQSMRQ